MDSLKVLTTISAGVMIEDILALIITLRPQVIMAILLITIITMVIAVLQIRVAIHLQVRL